MPKKQKGFSPVLIIIAIIAVIPILLFLYFTPQRVMKMKESFGQPPSFFGKQVEKIGCKKEFTKFSQSPIKIEDIELIEPMGRMWDEHVTPTDHQYFRPAPWNIEPKPRDVIAPGDGIITRAERLNFSGGGRYTPITDYRLIIQHSCDVSTIYIHITEFADKVSEGIGEFTSSGPKNINIPVSAGEVIGRIKLLPELGGAYQVDFTVIDERVNLGFVTPAFYKDEPWKVHVAHPFDYFDEPVKGKLLAKSLRSVKPAGGKIDYDIDGKLVGNWFLEGTDYLDEGDQRYWRNHLTLAYNYIDPTHIQISIGDLAGKPAQFNIKGNVPDPAEVGVGQLVKYELTGFNYVQKGTGRMWDQETFMKDIVVQNNAGVEGVMLIKLLEDRKLKMEVFLGKTAAQVSDFTPKAKIYHR